MWSTPQLREPKPTGGWGSTHLETYEKNRHIGPSFLPNLRGWKWDPIRTPNGPVSNQWDRWIKVGTWRIWAVETIWVFPKMVGFPPKSSILIGFSIIFTIHFGVPQFLETPISSIQKNIKWKTSAPKANFYNMFFFQDHNYLLLNEAANYSLSNSPHMARKWHCSGNCTLWSPLTTPVHPILGAKKRGRSVLWVCT